MTDERERLIAEMERCAWPDIANMLRADAAEIAALKRDAERYRWLRSNWERAGRFLNPDDLNACVDWHIDAALASGRVKEGEK